MAQRLHSSQTGFVLFKEQTFFFFFFFYETNRNNIVWNPRTSHKHAVVRYPFQSTSQICFVVLSDERMRGWTETLCTTVGQYHLSWNTAEINNMLRVWTGGCCCCGCYFGQMTWKIYGWKWNMKNNDVAFKIIVFLLSLGSTLWKKLIINYD